MEQTINKDYIGVVKENGGVYSYAKINIEKSDELLSKLNAMKNNPNRTVLDLQECFEMHFKHSSKRAYDCCLPHNYSSVYIGWVCYPQILKFEEYKTGKLRIGEQIRERHAACESDIAPQCLSTEIAKKEKEYDQLLKSNFMSQAIRYIEAVDFTAASSKLKDQPVIRMMSHEKIGWNKIEYKISDDLDITVKTNFGYGSSSYFFVNVRYKGVDLLPYSQLVRYYYARMAHIIAHTRSFDSDRKSWQIALDFVAGIGNKTQQGELSFACDWLKHEITEMLEGLNKIRHNPKKVLENMKNQRTDSDGLYSVCNIYGSDLNSYEIYPDELTAVFQAEKITNALRFITSLQSAEFIYQPAEDAILMIQNFNRQIAPVIEANMEEIHGKMEELQVPLNIKNTELVVCEKAIKAHEEALDALVKENSEPTYEIKQEIRQAYENQHPEYTMLLKKEHQLQDDISKIERKLNKHQGFMNRLQQCLTDIAEADLLAA